MTRAIQPDRALRAARIEGIEEAQKIQRIDPPVGITIRTRIRGVVCVEEAQEVQRIDNVVLIAVGQTGLSHNPPEEIAQPVLIIDDQIVGGAEERYDRSIRGQGR